SYTSRQMTQEAENFIRARLRTPRAAAIAGILFSVLLITGLLLFRLSGPADPLEAGAWLRAHSNPVALALNLVAFAGIALFWVIAVLRARLGELEGRFFATVFLGRGLLFLAMLFASAAVAGGIILAYAARPSGGGARLGDVPLRPRRHLRDHEPLCGQDGSSVHDLHVHTRD